MMVKYYCPYCNKVFYHECELQSPYDILCFDDDFEGYHECICQICGKIIHRSRHVYNPVTKRYYILRSRRTSQRRLKQIRELWGGIGMRVRLILYLEDDSILELKTETGHYHLVSPDTVEVNGVCYRFLALKVENLDYQPITRWLK